MPSRKLTRSLSMPLSRLLVPSPEYRTGSSPAPGYLTWDPTFNAGSYAYTNGDLTLTKSGTVWHSARSVLGVQTGKVQVQYGAPVGAGANIIFGVGTSSASATNYVGGDANAFGYNCTNGFKYHNGSGTAHGISVGAGVVVDALIDLDARTFTPRVGGAAQTVIDISSLVGDLYAMIALYNDALVMTGTFGDPAFDSPAALHNGWELP